MRYPFKPLLVPREQGASRRPLPSDRGRGVGRAREAIQLRRDHRESWQIPSEILGSCDILETDPPQSVLEIGTASGGTLFLLTRVAAPEALLISVDLRRGQFGGGYPAWRGRPVPLVRPRSSARAARARRLPRAAHPRAGSAAYWRAEPLDLLFVDGDHTYEGVKQDFADYAPLVRPGGIVALHDIVPGGPGKHGDPGGVPTFWQELKAGTLPRPRWSRTGSGAPAGSGSFAYPAPSA